MIELNTAIYNKLAANSSLITLLGGTALYPIQAPNDESLPYVVWNIQAGGDENLISVRSKDLYIYVRGYASTAGLAGSVAAQIDTSLHTKALTVSGWNNFWMTNTRDIEIVETTPGGEQVFASGGVYRVRINTTS